jgi:hypothetical protein
MTIKSLSSAHSNTIHFNMQFSAFLAAFMALAALFQGAVADPTAEAVAPRVNY